MQDSMKLNVLNVADNSKSLEILSGAALALVSSYAPFSIALSAAHYFNVSSAGNHLTQDTAAIAGLATTVVGVALALEMRRSPKALAITTGILFGVLGGATALTL